MLWQETKVARSKVKTSDMVEKKKVVSSGVTIPHQFLRTDVSNSGSDAVIKPTFVYFIPLPSSPFSTMAKSATVTKSKSATKDATEKRTRRPKADKEDKPKREPSAYQVFVKANMKAWNEANPGRSKEAMSQMALLWKNAPENPNRGKDTKARKPKDTASKPALKAAPKSKSKSKSKTKTKTKEKDADPEEEEEAEAEAPSSEQEMAPSSDD